MLKLSLIYVSFVQTLFINNSTIQFKMKYPNLADLLDAAAPGIDHANVLSYGCNCQFLDGRPLASAGSGHPVDPLDQVCKQYRDCQKCVQMDDGADCNVENVDWEYQTDLQVRQLDCLDPVKSCRRHLCECDRQFAFAIAEKFKYFDERFLNYDQGMCGQQTTSNKKMLAKPGPEAIITPSGEIFESEARCCGPTTGPKELFNVNKQECCSPKKKTYFLGPIGKCDLTNTQDGNRI